MLISLPIQVNDKCINVTFQVLYNINETISVTIYNNTKIMKSIIANMYNVIVSSKLYGINIIPVYFPLIFNIVNNMLVCDIYFIIATLSDYNDFFSLLLCGINTLLKKKYEYFNSTNINTIISTIKLNNIIDDTEYTCIDNLINRVYYKTNRFLNVCLSLLTSSDNYNIPQNSKILHIINAIKQLKVSFYGNESNIGEHLDYIKSNKVIIKKKHYYFLAINERVIKIYILGTNNNMIQVENYTLDKSQFGNISVYPPKFKQHISVLKFIKNIIVTYYKELVEITANIIYKKNLSYVKILLGLYNNNMD